MSTVEVGSGVSQATLTAGLALKASLAGGNAFSGAQTFADGTISRYSALVSTQANTTYTLLPADNGTVIKFTNASGVTITLPASLATGFNVTLIQEGDGQLSLVAAGSGVIRNRQLHTKSAGKYAVISLLITANTGAAPVYYLAGDGST